MNDLLSVIFAAVFEAFGHPWLRAVVVVLASVVAAKVLDVVISRILYSADDLVLSREIAPGASNLRRPSQCVV